MSVSPANRVVAMDRPQTALARVTVVIVNYNSGRWLGRCVRALRTRSSKFPAVYVLDNASTDDSLQDLPPLPSIRVRSAPRNLGFGRAVNWVVGQIDTEYVLIINPDCLLASESLQLLINELDAEREAGMASGRVFDMCGNEQRGSRRQLPTPRRLLGEVLGFPRRERVDLLTRPAPDSASDVEAVSGACMLIRTSVFRRLGGFDAGFPMHFEDLDLMARMRQAGWQIRLVPEVAISHAGGVSSKRRPVRVLWAKHRGLWRYLNKHCLTQWPRWQRPLWWAGIWLHALIQVPLIFLRRR